MTREWRSPIPYAAVLVGAGIGVVGLGIVGLVVGAEVCTNCHDFDGRWLLGGVTVGAAAGGVAGGQAGVWAVRRGSRATVVAAAVIGFLLVGAAGAWAATEAWQRTHPAYVLRPPDACRVPADARPGWCYGPLGHELATRVARPSNRAAPHATAAGGVLAGVVGGAVAAALQRRAERRARAAAERRGERWTG